MHVFYESLSFARWGKEKDHFPRRIFLFLATALGREEDEQGLRWLYHVCCMLQTALQLSLPQLSSCCFHPSLSLSHPRTLFVIAHLDAHFFRTLGERGPSLLSPPSLVPLSLHGHAFGYLYSSLLLLDYFLTLPDLVFLLCCCWLWDRPLGMRTGVHGAAALQGFFIGIVLGRWVFWVFWVYGCFFVFFGFPFFPLYFPWHDGTAVLGLRMFLSTPFFFLFTHHCQRLIPPQNVAGRLACFSWQRKKQHHSVGLCYSAG
ncbi:hypothetical protein M426DRAFT_172513 [Hypoxylon sp. CI-4A]|nr:hypothetical protein M426DRAFT_172513 [Hypoxylon sp. CI-4A]